MSLSSAFDTFQRLCEFDVPDSEQWSHAVWRPSLAHVPWEYHSLLSYHFAIERRCSLDVTECLSLALSNHAGMIFFAKIETWPFEYPSARHVLPFIRPVVRTTSNFTVSRDVLIFSMFVQNVLLR